MIAETEEHIERSIIRTCIEKAGTYVGVSGIVCGVIAGITAYQGSKVDYKLVRDYAYASGWSGTIAGGFYGSLTGLFGVVWNVRNLVKVDDIVRECKS